MNFEFEYLHENEFLSKTILACLSGALDGSIHEKNRGRKSRDTASLSHTAAARSRPFLPAPAGSVWPAGKC